MLELAVTQHSIGRNLFLAKALPFQAFLGNLRHLNGNRTFDFFTCAVNYDMFFALRPLETAGEVCPESSPRIVYNFWPVLVFLAGLSAGLIYGRHSSLFCSCMILG